MSPESSPDLLEQPKEIASANRSSPRQNESKPANWRSYYADSGLIALFLCLTFLLGAFPLKDTDIYWHLRTGDLIRQTGRVPRTDLFTFTREGVPWIDLHWIFQIAISWVYERGGVVALNLTKCAVTSVAMCFLLSARRRDWPVWVTVIAWIPAVLVLGGRMYVRPETLTLLYLSIFLAILFRWDRHPRLALLLPVVQVAWVNSHGLFVLGPIVLGFGLIDAALRFGLFAPERRRWWRTILVASLLTGVACLINPYFITGAVFPIALAGTMSNPIFSQNVAELMTIPEFIRVNPSAGFTNLSMQLHFATMILGALSFLIPLGGRIVGILHGPNRPIDSAEKTSQPRREVARADKKRKRTTKRTPKADTGKSNERAAVDRSGVWRLSPFRVLLFVAFSVLSFQATRNSHQFAAVVGTITAWNFGEWAGCLRRRRLATGNAESLATSTGGRLAAFGTLSLVLVWVGSGLFYKMTDEGRIVSLGEEPVFFAHEAARFAGRPGMPSRFLSFHNGHASVFEYYHGPQRKVYTDPRLEVAGPDLFKNYMDLAASLKRDAPGWEARLNEMGRPVVLIDHEHNWEIGATLFRSAHWRCVWFDPIAAVFVHDSFATIINDYAVDFAARHFDAKPEVETRSVAELTALAKAYRSYAPAVAPPGAPLGRPFCWLGLDAARRLLQLLPDSPEAWKRLGQIEMYRAFPTADAPSPRFRARFDPVLDLAMVRATYALRRAAELAPRDFATLLTLRLLYDFRLMNEAALPVAGKLSALYTTNLQQAAEQARNETARADYLRKLGPLPPPSWRNLSELDQIVTDMLAAGRVESAAKLLEQAYPPEKAPWDVIDKMATLWLHLGEPARARELWRKATTVPHPGLKNARIATTELVEGNFDAARRHYEQAMNDEPTLFEAHYGLAVLEQDLGQACAAYAQAGLALKTAPDQTARAAARVIVKNVARFARPSAGADGPIN